jgi:hypothetical protein
MRKIALTRRLALDAAFDEDVEIVLVKITHDDLDEPVLLSSDPTTRLSLEPLLYGTNSAWNNPEGKPFLFMLMSTILPGDQDDTPAATVDMAVVLASDPQAVQMEQLGLKLVSADGNANEITLTVSRDPITAEPWPSGRMTRQRFPGLHK